jgi:hypothetical protein
MGAAQGPLIPVWTFVIYTWFPVGRWAAPNAVGFMVATLGFAAAGPGVASLVGRYGCRLALQYSSIRLLPSGTMASTGRQTATTGFKL